MGLGVTAMEKPRLRILLASPRGSCAGVVRAIGTVEAALELFGPPIFVHHEIVHNPHVVEGFRARGVVFVESPDEVPAGGRMIISAHGAPPATFARSAQRGVRVVDATCPLVTKIHREVGHHIRRGHKVILIGHRGHPEIVGTLGHCEGEAMLVETLADAEAVSAAPGDRYAYATQTTLGVSETEEIVAALRARISDLVEPQHCDICYATTNRQAAVQAIARRCDGIVVVGGANSSNSQRLVEVAKASGCDRTWFVSRGRDAPLEEFEGLGTLGISSGASTPADLVDELLDALDRHFLATVETVTAAREDEHYKLPSLGPFDGPPA